MNTDGGPAFPLQALAAPGSEIAWGMSLRDWFAGQEVLEDECADLPTATMEALAGRPYPGASGPRTTAQDRLDVLAWNADWRAGLKFLRADAMLRARERGVEADDDEAWFRSQVNACVYSLPDGSHEAAIDYGSLSWTACGANRATAIRALRAKVEGSAQ